MFNLEKLEENISNNNRYEKRLSTLVTAGQDIDRIKIVVDQAILNIEENRKSFVIYGEPQSGKTEMMIALTAKLLDLNFKIIVILLNDSVQLLSQNLERFQRSGLSPSPKKFSEILPPEVKIGNYQWVIFCKKNSKDLQKLISKIDGHSGRVVIDDEADYATPNSKINKKEKSKINDLTGLLIGDSGIYIGVTATPARLDLNRTHNNQNDYWIDFPPHSNYTGQDVFFPTLIEDLPYKLNLLPENGDDPKYLREALFSFMIGVAYLNVCVNDPEQNYSMLIHTSGKKADHTVDYKQIVKIFESLKDKSDKSRAVFLNKIWEMAEDQYPGHSDELTRYIIMNCDCNNIVVMNSDKEMNAADNKTATDPTSPFTIIIGGNIVSRGVTFKNLLSMFFTRDVKHKLQQDTYIQRARMFGYRGNYLKYFELIIPNQLYLDWQKCFIFHRLSLESRKQNQHSPIWLDGQRITAVASGSIDKTNVDIDNGEMSFALFKFDSAKIKETINKEKNQINKLKSLSNLLGNEKLPDYLINYIESFCPLGENSIAIHEPKSISGYNEKPGELDKSNIIRAKGFIGKREREEDKFPNAIHHINILFNEDNNARIFYKYQGSIRFLKTKKYDK